MILFNRYSLLLTFSLIDSVHALEKHVPQRMAARIFAKAAYHLHADSPYVPGRCLDVLTYGAILPPRITFWVGEQLYYLDVKASMQLAQALLAQRALKK